jgi:hypothetical protein
MWVCLSLEGIFALIVRKESARRVSIQFVLPHPDDLFTRQLEVFHHHLGADEQPFLDEGQGMLSC